MYRKAPRPKIRKATQADRDASKREWESWMARFNAAYAQADAWEGTNVVSLAVARYRRAGWP
jgi:hypothetical protein